MDMTIQVNGETYLSTKETAELLGISRAKLNELVRDKMLKQYEQPVRKTPIYRESEVKRLLEVQER